MSEDPSDSKREPRRSPTGEVYEVGKHWLGFGPLAAELILDDLNQYLVEERG